MDLALALQDVEPFRLTVDQYYEMFEAGIVGNDPKVELIEGVIVRMSPTASMHGFVVTQLLVRISLQLQAIGSPLVGFSSATVAMPPYNAPDPDIAIGERQADRHFIPVANARLLIEVSRTSLRKDLRLKRDIYAAAGVPEYWVVDPDRAEVHRFADPVDGQYRAEPPVPLAGPLISLTIPGLAIDGAGIL